MGEAFPQLVSSQKQIERVLLQEEEQFVKTLDKGLRLLEQDIAELKGDVIPGETIFTLYDTYGFPVDLTNDIARERGLTLDYDGYEKAMENMDDADAYQKAFDQMESAQAWDFETKYKQILSKLKLDDLSQIVGKLSGGQKKRIAMAIALLSDPQLLSWMNLPTTWIWK